MFRGNVMDLLSRSCSALRTPGCGDGPVGVGAASPGRRSEEPVTIATTGLLAHEGFKELVTQVRSAIKKTPRADGEPAIVGHPSGTTGA